jgi:Xaa-Pro aminopeptidase
VHFDFGVKVNGYCSDIQRVVYGLKPGEDQPPEEIQKGFTTVVDAIEAARLAMKPGALGIHIDTIARNLLLERGYPEYKYATGHHLGRTVHDGAGILGPAWALGSGQQESGYSDLRCLSGIEVSILEGS